MNKISVIIIVYNVAPYIERCLKSLFEQSYSNLEYIFVNDCSTDNSIDILYTTINKYPSRKDQIKIINNPQNYGQCRSRVIGILNASGEYITHCDPDDWIDTSMYETLYKEIINKDVDIVVSPYYSEYKDVQKISHTLHPFYNKKIRSKDIIKDAYKTGFEWMTWRYIYKRKECINPIIKNIPNIRLWEDVAISNIIFYYSDTVYFYPKPMYHYNRANINSCCNTLNLNRTLDCITISQFLSEQIKDIDLKKTILWYKFQAKSGLLIHSTINNWMHNFPESHKYIFAYKQIPFIYRLLYILLAHKIYWPYSIFQKLRNISKK